MNEGREAIELTLAQFYPGQDPFTFPPEASRQEWRSEPLEEIWIFRHASGHWHYVSFGFSELHEKISDEPSRSGWGFELTFRLPAGGSEESPPVWPALLMFDLARYVFGEGKPFDVNHHMDLGEALDPDSGSGLTALAYAVDPELGSIMTPNGRLVFLQMVGLTSDEEDLAARWSVSALTEMLARQNRWLVTDPERSSILEDRDLASEIRSRLETEGSAQTSVFAEVLSWKVSGEKLELRLGPTEQVLRNLGGVLEGRTGRGADFRVLSSNRSVTFRASERASWELRDQNSLVLRVDTPLRNELSTFLETRRILFASRHLPGFSLRLVDAPS